MLRALASLCSHVACVLFCSARYSSCGQGHGMVVLALVRNMTRVIYFLRNVWFCFTEAERLFREYLHVFYVSEACRAM